jgi:FdhD protein
MSGNKGYELPPQLIAGNALLGLGYAKPVVKRVFVRAANNELEEQEGPVAEETPVAISYNGRPHVVMMATPADLEDFGVGFTLSEQIVANVSEISAVQVVRHAQGIELQIEIGEAAAAVLAQRARNLVGRTSCGLCGVELISDALRDVKPVEAGVHFEIDSLGRAESDLMGRQNWNRETGAMHAAGWATADGSVAVVREDVGRHNALDKVIGALGRSGRNGREGFIVITSRASYELVQKTAVAGIPMIAAVSRPTGLAIRLADAMGVALVGLLRQGTANIYADVNNVLAHGGSNWAPRWPVKQT